MLKLLLLPVIILASGCSPIVTYHGFNSPDKLIKASNNYTPSKYEIISRFGPPSFSKQKLNNESLYYVSYIREKYAFFRPEITQRKVMALHFKDSILDSFKQYGLEDGKVIDISDKKTPSFGKDLNVIQEILSNVGKFNSVPGTRRNDGSVLGRRPGGI